jgi:hypothetical protein
MAFEYSVMIMDGTTIAMHALIGGNTGNIVYVYDITESSNTTNILYPGGTNTCDLTKINNTRIYPFPYFSLYNADYYTIDNQLVTPSNNPDNPILVSIEITDTVCFNKGTKILCLNDQLADEYIPIELLKVGDFVKTYKHGYRKIIKTIKGMNRNNPKKWNTCMYKMVKTDTNGLLEDLIVTGGHSILVDSISETEQAQYDAMGLTEWCKETIDGKRLLLSYVSDQFTAMQDNERYTYYHLLLENNDDDEERFGIWANGILTETPNEKYMSR